MTYHTMFLEGIYFQVITDEFAHRHESYTVPRTWKERFLSWPWYPWLSENVVHRKVADDVYLLKPNVLIMHPRVLEKLREKSVISSITERPGLIAFAPQALKRKETWAFTGIILQENTCLKRTGREKVPYYLAVLVLIMVVILVML